MAMNREEAKDLITRYFRAWVKRDFDLFAGTVHDETVVRECTGAVIEGKEQLHRWFREWNGQGNEVLDWRIHRFGYDGVQQSAFVEWTFKCRYEGREYEWDGCSAVSFRDDRICELNEYEMKREKHCPYGA
jgi:ketosteroid isomerase-like protein